jgi:hypothetical protein
VLGPGGAAKLRVLKLPLFGVSVLIGLVELARAPDTDERLYANDAIEARVRQPRATRAHAPMPVDVEIRNVSPATWHASLRVREDGRSPLGTTVTVPDPGEDGAVHLDALSPGEQRLVTLEIEPGGAGPQAAELEIETSRGDELLIPMRVFVAP